MLSHLYITLLSHLYITMLSHLYITTLSHPYITMLSHPYITMLSHLYITMISHLYITMMSHLYITNSESSKYQEPIACLCLCYSHLLQLEICTHRVSRTPSHPHISSLRVAFATFAFFNSKWVKRECNHELDSSIRSGTGSWVLRHELDARV